MDIDEKIIAEAIKERGKRNKGLMNDRHCVITRPDGTQYRTYARLFIRPTILEVARQYMRSFFERQGVGNVSNDPMAELVDALNGELSEKSKAFLSLVIMSAFLEGGIFCACGRGRLEDFVKLAMKEGMIDTNPTNANKQLELDF